MLRRLKKIPVVRKSERGVGIIDILISIAVITLAFWSFSQLAVLGVRVKREAERREAAIYLAEEGIEAVRLLRDESWSAYIASLNAGVDYFPVISGTQWVLEANDPGVISGLYTRTVRFESVDRDANDDIVSSGTLDPDTREVTVSVGWDNPQKEFQITTYLTNFLTN